MATIEDRLTDLEDKFVKLRARVKELEDNQKYVDDCLATLNTRTKRIKHNLEEGKPASPIAGKEGKNVRTSGRHFTDRVFRP